MSSATDQYIKLVPLSWSELARRTWREVIEDDVLGLAAQLSYYFFVVLFPANLFLLVVDDDGHEVRDDRRRTDDGGRPARDRKIWRLAGSDTRGLQRHRPAWSSHRPRPGENTRSSSSSTPRATEDRSISHSQTVDRQNGQKDIYLGKDLPQLAHSSVRTRSRSRTIFWRGALRLTHTTCKQNRASVPPVQTCPARDQEPAERAARTASNLHFELPST